MKLALVIGTRPEAIKMAPIVLELRKRNIKHIVIATTQHREMLEQSLSLFGITCDYDLDIMKQDQDMFYVTTSVLNAIKPILQNEKPDLLLVQGDTTSAFAASLAAFYLGIPVGHVEAGLRTGNLNNPFPEELNRQMISRIATVHLAPTEWAKQNLLNEGTNAENIYVTGNTVIDALLTVLQNDVVFDNEQLRSIDFEKNKIILLTAHRRENFGEPMRRIFQACRILVETNSDIEIIYPVHLNPNVRGIAREVLENVPRIHLIEPMGYVQFIHLMKRSYLILTDSGGVQ